MEEKKSEEKKPEKVTGRTISINTEGILKASEILIDVSNKCGGTNGLNYLVANFNYPIGKKYGNIDGVGDFHVDFSIFDGLDLRVESIGKSAEQVCITLTDTATSWESGEYQNMLTIGELFHNFGITLEEHPVLGAGFFVVTAATGIALGVLCAPAIAAALGSGTIAGATATFLTVEQVAVLRNLISDAAELEYSDEKTLEEVYELNKQFDLQIAKEEGAKVISVAGGKLIKTTTKDPFWQYLGDVGIGEATMVFKKIMDGKEVTGDDVVETFLWESIGYGTDKKLEQLLPDKAVPNELGDIEEYDEILSGISKDEILEAQQTAAKKYNKIIGVVRKGIGAIDDGADYIFDVKENFHDYLEENGRKEKYELLQNSN